MKKFTFAIVAMMAMMFASCGNKAQQPAADDVDSTKTFEQEQIEASIKMHLDSPLRLHEPLYLQFSHSHQRNLQPGGTQAS